MLIVGGVCVALILVFGIIMPLNRSVAHAHARLAAKQADLVWMRGVAPELAAAGTGPSTPTSQQSMLVVVDRAAREAGLGTALTSSEPSGAGGLQVRLEKAPFDNLVAWLARLAQQNGVIIDSATIEKTGDAGLVNAAIVLRPGLM